MSVFGFKFDEFTGAVSVTVDEQIVTDANGDAVGVYGVVPVEALAPATAAAFIAPLSVIAKRMGAELPAAIDALEKSEAEVAKLTEALDTAREANDALVAQLVELAAAGEGEVIGEADGIEKVGIEAIVDGEVHEAVLGDAALSSIVPPAAPAAVKTPIKSAPKKSTEK